MPGKRRRALVILTALCIWIFCTGAGDREEEPALLYEDGDVVGFIGDSITHVEYLPVSYVELLDNYYLSHYPKRDIGFRNLGMAGYTVRDILDIYDADPAFRGINKAVILLGMNDAMQKIPTEEYLTALEELVNRLKEDGLSGEDILVLSPTPYDQTCGINYDRNGFPYQTTDTGLQDFTEKLPDKTAEWGVAFADLHTPMRNLSIEIQKENDRNTLTVGDCIHPALEGHWMMVYEILTAQRALSRNDVMEEKDGFYQGEKGMCWSWSPRTLPMEQDEGLETLCSLFPTAGALVWEEFRVEGLSREKSYTVAVDGTELGTYSGEELAEQIDLAAAEENPLRDVMRQAAELNRERHHNAALYRAALCAAKAENPDLSEERMRIRYTGWKTEDNRLREEIRVLVTEAVSRKYTVTVAEEGYPAKELQEEARHFAEQAEKERAAREAAEQSILWLKKKLFILK